MRSILAILLLPLAALAASPPDLKGFETSVRPLLENYCYDCHDAADPKGDLNLESISGDLINGSHIDPWIKILDQLTLRQMPPPKKDQLSRTERDALIVWIRQELLKGGRSPEDKLQRPGFGNYVEHDRLFGKEDFGPSFSPPRLWRIRPTVYQHRVHSLAKNGRYVQPFTLNSSGHGFRDYAHQYSLSGADLNQLISNANTVADQLTGTTENDGVLKRDKATPQVVFDLLTAKGPPEEAKIHEVIHWFLPRILLRDPSEKELLRYTAFAKKTLVADGPSLGTRNLIAAFLLSPESLYRSEQGQGKPDEFGRSRLSPREIAFALAYSLTDTRPDQKLLKAADDGSLSNPANIASHVQRLLNDPKIEKPRILQFFREYFEYEKALDVFKDEALNRDHLPEFLVEDTDRLILYIYEQDKDVLRELLTTRKAFIQYHTEKGEVRKRTGKRNIHSSYSLPPDWKWIPDQPIELPNSQRSGILTQPAWLVGKSGNFDNHAIWRGLWVRTKLLGGTIPDLPITVDAQLPDDPERTLRDRMEVTRDSYCWKCHQKMDPLGLTFEMFDHFGRWRTRELDKPVDSSGKLTDTEDASLNADLPGAVTLLSRLSESERVRQVFIRHVFRFFMGRNETLPDSATLRRADQDYLESGGSMKALITSLLTSDSFLYRKDPRSQKIGR